MICTYQAITWLEPRPREKDWSVWGKSIDNKVNWCKSTWFFDISHNKSSKDCDGGTKIKTVSYLEWRTGRRRRQQEKRKRKTKLVSKSKTQISVTQIQIGKNTNGHVVRTNQYNLNPWSPLHVRNCQNGFFSNLSGRKTCRGIPEHGLMTDSLKWTSPKGLIPKDSASISILLPHPDSEWLQTLLIIMLKQIGLLNLDRSDMLWQ